jgi:hypothetical protein
MNSGLIILLLVGIILMTANSVKTKVIQKNEKDEKIVYKYLPLDIDAFYREEGVSKPSKLYYSLFQEEDLKR